MTPKIRRKRIPNSYSESGHYLFSAGQTKKRFALCSEALWFPKYRIFYRDIFLTEADREKYSLREFTSDKDFFRMYYSALGNLGWNCKYKDYKKAPSPEGTFYPFVRYTAVRLSSIVDTGCIWIGARDCYPRIFVDNGSSGWVEPYGGDGYVQLEPFAPLSARRQGLL